MDLKGNFHSYYEHFDDLQISLLDTKVSLEQHSYIIQSALEQFEKDGPHSHTWDTLEARIFKIVKIWRLKAPSSILII